MKLNRIILIAVIAVLTIFISTMLFAAQVMKKVERKAAVPAQRGEVFTSCYQASNLTLSQEDLAKLQIVPLTDPYCCNKSYLSEERYDCLKRNSETLKHIYSMLYKIGADLMKKCSPAYPMAAPILCVPFSQESLNAKIHGQANCVKEIINVIGDSYDELTKCPND